MKNSFKMNFIQRRISIGPNLPNPRPLPAVVHGELLSPRNLRKERGLRTS
jgi:hypothetical protein